MHGVLEGFITLALVIGLGFALAHIGFLDERASLQLNRLTFYVASPVLMFLLLSRTRAAELFSGTLLAHFTATAVVFLAYGLLAPLLWRRTRGEVVIGSMASGYVNAANLGIPIATFVLGNAAATAPIILIQQVVIQPVALAVLDHETHRGGSTLRRVIGPLVVPMTAGTLLGLLASLVHVREPALLTPAVEMVAAMAVPLMLIAYGVSLRLGPRPGVEAGVSELAFITVLKLVAMPAVGAAVAYGLGLPGPDLLMVAVLCALPSAQNIFVNATIYDRGVTLARDAIFATTVLAVPAIVVIVALLG